ncbi:MAG TPA: response regulator [Polyangia bacterium]|nr:response regulator [Polyangia bacterium]
MSKTRILIVEDYADSREMYAEFLRLLGFEVSEATHGAEALEKAQATRPDLIVMDLSLPVMSGFEATQKLKADRRTRDIPVIAVTAHAHKRQLEARKAGFDGFVEKPCLPDRLMHEVRRVLDRRLAKQAR